MRRLFPALLAEAIGVFALSFIGIMAINQPGGGLVGVAFAHGLILAIMISAFGHISGGHFNPAVTVGLLVLGKIKPAPALAYIIAQIIGGVIAGLAVFAIMPVDPHSKAAATSVITNATPTVADHLALGAAFLAEMIATFFLMTAVLGTAVDPRAPKIGGFGIGLTVTADILAIGPLTGAAMNPARAVGPALAATICGAGSPWNGNWWSNHWVFWLGPIAGAVLASVLYKFFFAPEAENK